MLPTLQRIKNESRLPWRVYKETCPDFQSHFAMLSKKDSVYEAWAFESGLNPDFVVDEDGGGVDDDGDLLILGQIAYFH